MLNKSKHCSLSFILCCYNSVGRIEETLSALAAEISLSSDVSCEIILVDNNSSDGTAETAVSILSALTCCSWLIVPESRSGLMSARLAGVRASSGTYLAFIDDDNHLLPGWIAALLSVIRSNNSFGMIGSLAMAYVTDFPIWFERYQSSYACGPFNRNEGELSRGQINYGAGMVIPREVWGQIENRLSEALDFGRSGGGLGAGDDGLINALICDLGHSRLYCSSMRLRHAIPAGRLNWDYLVRLQSGFGSGTLKIYSFMLKRTRNNTFMYFRRCLFLLFFSVKDVLKGVCVKLFKTDLFYCEGSRHRLAYVRSKSVLKQLFFMLFPCVR